VYPRPWFSQLNHILTSSFDRPSDNIEEGVGVAYDEHDGCHVDLYMTRDRVEV
jgi:hypothetical protein